MDKPVELYLKCFCGTIFENGAWRDIYPWENEYKSVLKYLNRKQFYEQEQVLEEVQKIGVSKELPVVSIKVQLDAASKKYENEVYYMTRADVDNG